MWLIGRTLSDATTLGQSGPGSDGNEEVLCIPQSFSITGASSLDCLGLYPGHLFGEGVRHPPLHRCIWCILQPQPTGLGKKKKKKQETKSLNKIYIYIYIYIYI